MLKLRVAVGLNVVFKFVVCFVLLFVLGLWLILLVKFMTCCFASVTVVLVIWVGFISLVCFSCLHFGCLRCWLVDLICVVCWVLIE